MMSECWRMPASSVPTVSSVRSRFCQSESRCRHHLGGPVAQPRPSGGRRPLRLAAAGGRRRSLEPPATVQRPARTHRAKPRRYSCRHSARSVHRCGLRRQWPFLRTWRAKFGAAFGARRAQRLPLAGVILNFVPFPVHASIADSDFAGYDDACFCDPDGSKPAIGRRQLELAT